MKVNFILSYKRYCSGSESEPLIGPYSYAACVKNIDKDPYSAKLKKSLETKEKRVICGKVKMKS